MVVSFRTPGEARRLQWSPTLAGFCPSYSSTRGGRADGDIDSKDWRTPGRYWKEAEALTSCLSGHMDEKEAAGLRDLAASRPVISHGVAFSVLTPADARAEDS